VSESLQCKEGFVQKSKTKTVRYKSPEQSKGFIPNADTLAKVIKKVNLLEICLVKSSCELGDKSHPNEDIIRQYKITVDVVESKPLSKDFWVICNLGLRDIPNSKGDEKFFELFKIEASFQLSYRLKNRTGVTKNDILNFGVINGPYNVWSFWREFVLNMALRMGLTSIVVPLKPPPVPLKLAIKKAKTKPIKE
jgi:hypothetical protein